MALINCPECDHEISDKAQSCPHCGYVLPNSPSDPPVREPQPTSLGLQEKNMLAGSIGTICGMALLVVGILAAFVILPIGLIIAAAGAILLSKGNSAAVGTHKVTCPYCGTSGTMESPAQSYRCSACSKKSVKRDGFLYPVK